MEAEIYKKKRVNNRLTQTIIKCHEAGYTEDFCYNGPGQGISDLSTLSVIYHSFSSAVMDIAYDSLTSEFKYVYTIMTHCGKKGILVLNRLPIS